MDKRDTEQEVRKVKLNFDFRQKIWRVGTRDNAISIKKVESCMNYCLKKDKSFQYRLVTSGELRQAREWSFEARISAESLSRESRVRSDLKLLDEALQAGEIDFYVEDLVHMPLTLPDYLAAAAILPRKDARDVLVLRKGSSFSSIAHGSNVGAYGLRRPFLLRQLRSDLVVNQSEDSLYQYMERLMTDDISAFIVPATDLLYSDLGNYKSKFKFYPFATNVFCPAPAQGMLALFCLKNKPKVLSELKYMADDEKTHKAYDFEIQIAQTLLGLQFDLQRRAAVYVHYGKDKQAQLFAINTESDPENPKSIEMNLNYDEQGNFPNMLLTSALASLMGKISFVGAGPADIDYMTIRGKELIETADVIIYDDPVVSSALSFAKATAVQLLLDKKITRMKSLLSPGEKVCRILMAYSRKGKDVVRLSVGDPWLLDSASAEAMRVAKQNMHYELVPGISTALAAPEFAGLPLTLEGQVNSVHIFDGRRSLKAMDKKDSDYHQMARMGGTLVFLMVSDNLPSLTYSLIASGMNESTAAVLIKEASSVGQEIITGTIANIATKAVAANIVEPATLVLSPLLHMKQYEKAWKWWPAIGVLSGKTILLATSRLKDDYAHALKKEAEMRGANVIELALLEHQTSTRLAEKLDAEFLQIMQEHKQKRKSDRSKLWFVFTSPSAILAMKECFRRCLFDIRNMANVKIAALGMATIEALKDWGFVPDYVPEMPDMEHMAAGLVQKVAKEDRVVQIRGSMSMPIIRVTLQLRNIDFTEIMAYETRQHMSSRDAVLQLIDDVNYVIFLSPNSIFAFFETLKMKAYTNEHLQELGVKFLPALQNCIKPLTMRGFSDSYFPEEYSVGGVMNKLTKLEDDWRYQHGKNEQ